MIKPIESFLKVDNLSVPHPARVLNNNDPRRLGRIKALVNGIIEGPEENLPWITAEQSFALGGSNTSGFSVPEVGTMTLVYFPIKMFIFPFIKDSGKVPEHINLF